ncbi:MAG: flagellar assembly protein A, partial [Candidatus Latescibacterota bacterium]
ADGFTVLGEPLVPELERDKTLESGSGVVMMGDGGIYSDRYGYLSVVDQEISVVSPIWVSPDRLTVYYFNFDQLGACVWPTYDGLLQELDHLGVKFGICHETLKLIVSGDPKILQETCIVIAEGKEPGKRKSLTQFFFEKRHRKIDDGIVDRFSATSLAQIMEPIDPVLPISAGMVLAVRQKGSLTSLDGMDIYGQVLSPEKDEDYENRVYKAGLNVTECHETDRISYVADICGYPVLDGDHIRVVSPVWTTDDWMKAYFVLLPHSSSIRPFQKKDILNLLERANVSFGIDDEVIHKLCHYRSTSSDVQVFLLASGIEAVPGQDGQIVLYFDQSQSAGQELEDGRMDFKERGTVQETMANDLIAERKLPEPGTPGRNIRGKEIPVQMGNRGLLFVGRNVRVEEDSGLQKYFATASGWPRVIKDTLAVTNRFKTRGDVDFHTGNLDMDGDVEIEGDVKSGFKIQATGSVIIHGGVERKAEIFSEEHVVIKGGVIGATLRSKLSLEAKFLKETNAYCGTNLLVRNYIEDSKVVAMENAMVQGNGGGERGLCVLGGQVLVAKTLDILGAGSHTGRRTQIAVGFNPTLKKEREKLTKGLDILNKRVSDLERFLDVRVLGGNWKNKVREKIGNIKSRAQFHAYLEKVKDLEKTMSLQQEIMLRIELVNQKQEDMIKESKLVVRRKVYAGTQLQVGHITRLLDRDIQATLIRLDETGRRLKSYSLE